MRTLTSGGGCLENPKETVVLSKLMQRESFYKAKALRIEKDLIFANEKIDQLEASIQELIQQESKASLQKEKDFEKFHQEIQDLTNRLQDEALTNKNREAELLKEIEKLKTDIAETKPNQIMEERITAYERLLTEIQETINEKEREVIIYKARLELFEKRLKQQNAFATVDLNEMEASPPSQVIPKKAVFYLEHALIFTEDGCLIRGEGVIENVGTEKLDTPLLCFRISPLDVVTLKGKIQLRETTKDLIVRGLDTNWTLIDNDWANKAKEREEIWLAPDRPISLESTEQLRIPDLQFSINRKYCKHVTIEGFIYFKKSGYKIKMVNPIIINF